MLALILLALFSSKTPEQIKYCLKLIFSSLCRHGFKAGTSIEKGRPLISRDKTKHNQSLSLIFIHSIPQSTSSKTGRLYINLINIVPSFVFSSYLLVSTRGRLVASLCVVGLSTQEPSIQKELTELHKIPTFDVFMGKNIKLDKAIETLQNLPRKQQTSAQVSSNRLISLNSSILTPNVGIL